MVKTKKVQFARTFYHDTMSDTRINEHLDNPSLTNCKVLLMVASSGSSSSSNIITVLFEYEENDYETEERNE